MLNETLQFFHVESERPAIVIVYDEEWVYFCGAGRDGAFNGVSTVPMEDCFSPFPGDVANKGCLRLGPGLDLLSVLEGSLGVVGGVARRITGPEILNVLDTAIEMLREIGDGGAIFWANNRHFLLGEIFGDRTPEHAPSSNSQEADFAALMHARARVLNNFGISLDMLDLSSSSTIGAGGGCWGNEEQYHQRREIWMDSLTQLCLDTGGRLIQEPS